MPAQVTLALELLSAITLWLAIKHAILAHRTARQRKIAHAGASCLGKVVAIQRPFMLDECTRLYFDYVPSGGEAPIRACHIARPNADKDARQALPPEGSTVTVRYLPERPHYAVIGKLVA